MIEPPHKIVRNTRQNCCTNPPAGHRLFRNAATKTIGAKGAFRERPIEQEVKVSQDPKLAISNKAMLVLSVD
jgi:hypothetical protein